MKKNQTGDGIVPCRQLLMKMKITLLLLIVSVVSVLATESYAQSTRLTLQLNDMAIKEVLEQVENQSEFRFFYNEKIDVNKKVSLNAKRQTVFEILDEVLSDTNIDYHVIGRQIALFSKGENESWKTISQQMQISGTVTNEQGEPLPGVSVVIKGTATGTVTDIDGAYNLTAEPGDVLVYSFIGMRGQEVLVANQSTINIVMVEEVVGVDEVVVIGYGTRQKKDLTGAVSQISSSEITKQNTLSPEFAMQGKMAGVYISNPGSDPTARPTVRIRGVSTLGYSDPLYVIDGIPLTEGGAASSESRTQDLRGSVNVFSMINPNDIESISVLKDASATAIYGVRASNGVILITTKRGKEGKARIDVSAKYGVQNIYKRYDMASIQQFVDWSIEAKENNPSYVPDQYYPLFDPSSEYYMGNSRDYTSDWVDAALVENAPIQDYNISVSGGNQTSTYAAGSGYSSQKNALFDNQFKRYSLFFNSDHELTKWLKIGESYRFIYTKTDSESGSDLATAFGVPWQPVYDSSSPDGYAPTGRDIDGTFYSYGYGAATRTNFLGRAKYMESKRGLLRNLGTVYAEFSPLDGLRVKGTVSFDYYTNTRDSYSEMNRGIYEVARGVVYPESTGNTYGRRLNENINIVKEFLIGYNNSFGKHNVDLVLNAMDQKVKWNNLQMAINSQSPITSWDQRRIEEGWPNENKGMFYERNISGLQGYMGRLSYNFDRRYYFDATVRRDGTSKFGPGYKWGTFPSFAAAWRISSEKFMEDIEWLDDLKIRAGWGETGNQETRDYAFLSLVNMNPKAGFGTTDEAGEGIIYPASTLGDFPIEDMSWETVTTSNLGFDAVMFDNKLTFTAEYYNRLTDGILQTISIPKVIGALNNPVVNLAKVENKGFEFQASYADKIGDLGCSVSANLTTVDNIVKKLYNGQPSTNGNVRIEEGYSINYIYGYKTDGIFQNDDEVTEYQSNITDAGYDAQKSPGDVRFMDLNGAPLDTDPEGTYVHNEPDGKIDAYDRIYLGKTIPGYYYGFSFNFDYKNWDMNLDFRGVGDVQKINTLGKQSISGFGSNFLQDYENRWTETNRTNSIPRAVQADPSGNNRISDRHVEDAGFLRFQNFQVGYNFRGAFMKKIGVSNLRCYFSGSNLFVISPYSDLDPEDISTPTTFSLGVNLSF